MEILEPRAGLHQLGSRPTCYIPVGQPIFAFYIKRVTPVVIDMLAPGTVCCKDACRTVLVGTTKVPCFKLTLILDQASNGRCLVHTVWAFWLAP